MKMVIYYLLITEGSLLRQVQIHQNHIYCTTGEVINGEYLTSGDVILCDDCHAKIRVSFGIDEEGA